MICAQRVMFAFFRFLCSITSSDLFYKHDNKMQHKISDCANEYNCQLNEPHIISQEMEISIDAIE